MSRRLAAAAIAIVLLGATACGSSADSSATSSIDSGSTGTVADADTVLTLEVIGGELAGGPRRDKASLGDVVKIVVTGNTDDDVHIHGYDLFVTLDDGAGELTFDALVPGVFEIELEDAGVLLVQLEVS